MTAARLAGGLLGGGVCVAAWLRRDRLGLPAAVGIALGAVVLLGPVVHPWYLLWAVVPLAAGSRLIRGAVGLSVALSLVSLPHGVSFTPRGVVAALAGLGLGSAVLALSQVRKRQPVPVDAEPADDPGRDGGDDRVVPELLPRVDVGDVHLDERPAQQGARVPDRV